MNTPLADSSPVRVHPVGASGLLLDAATGGELDAGVQERIWALAELLGAATWRERGVRDIVPGVNNLLLVVDPLVLHPTDAKRALLAAWQVATPRPGTAREIDIPVQYGGAHGEDLREVAQATGHSVEEFVALHSSATYSVSCIGAMPGFVYLTGLPAALFRPRRSTPRARVPKGTVILGGSQTGVMPVDAPSGWHMLGHTAVGLFDLAQPTPCLLSPGDRVRFRVIGITP